MPQNHTTVIRISKPGVMVAAGHAAIPIARSFCDHKKRGVQTRYRAGTWWNRSVSDGRRHIMDRRCSSLFPHLLLLFLPYSLTVPARLVGRLGRDALRWLSRGLWPLRGPENLTSKRTRIIGDNAGVAEAP